MGDHAMALKQGQKCIKYFQHMSVLISSLISGKRKQNFDFGQQTEVVMELELFLNHIQSVTGFILNQLQYKNYLDKSHFDEFEKGTLNSKVKQFDEKWAQSISIAFFMHVQFIPLKKIKH